MCAYLAARRVRADSGSSEAASSRRWMMPTAGCAPMTPISAWGQAKTQSAPKVLRVHGDESTAEAFRIIQPVTRSTIRLGKGMYQRGAETDHPGDSCLRPGMTTGVSTSTTAPDSEALHFERSARPSGRCPRACPRRALLRGTGAGWQSRPRPGHRSARTRSPGCAPIQRTPRAARRRRRDGRSRRGRRRRGGPAPERTRWVACEGRPRGATGTAASRWLGRYPNRSRARGRVQGVGSTKWQTPLR